MTCHYPDLGSSLDWLKQISHAARPMKSTTQIWVMTRHQYGISALVTQTSFRKETSNQRWRRGMSAVFSGYPITKIVRFLVFLEGGKNSLNIKSQHGHSYACIMFTSNGNANLYHVTKFPHYLSFAVHYFYT